MQMQMEKEAAIELIQRRIAEGNSLAVKVTRNSDTDGWAAKVEHSIVRVIGNDQEWVPKFKHRPSTVVMGNPSRNAELAREGVAKTIARLNGLIEIIGESENPEEILPAQELPAVMTNKIFLVHGRADAPKNEVARFLGQLGLQVVILHERPNRGRTLISKFQEESADVSFAVVLVTADDTGGIAGGDAQPRARQNVIFELGFFIGRLGADRVCALVAHGVEKPSDYDGVAYVSLDPNGGWKNELTRELVAARIPVDFTKAFGS